MPNKKKKLSAVLAITWIYTTIIILVVNQAADAQEMKSLGTIEIVGTRIKRTDRETPTPTQVITAEEIRQSGAVSVGELLNNIPASSSGNVQDLSYGSGFARGVSTISLRGLGSQATLILVNGRRIAASPYADPRDGESQLFNLNAIPLSAIERIEVLKSGASAIYGSDAMAGVVNIVLRKNYRGAEAGVNYSRNHEGEFGNRRAYGTVIFGNPAQDNVAGHHGFLSFSDSKRNATRLVDTHNVAEDDLAQIYSRNTIRATTNSYPANYFRERIPGSGAFTRFVRRDPRCPAALVLANGACGNNPYEFLNLVDAQHSNTLSSGINFDITPNLSLFSEFEFSRVTSTYIRPPSAVPEDGSVWFAQDGRRNLFQFILPAGHPDNPINAPVALRYRFQDIGPLTSDITLDTIRLLVGAKGYRSGWDWESAFSYMRIDRDTIDKGGLYFPAVVNAIETGSYRPYGNNSPQTLASISPPIYETGKSTSTSLDLKGSRELMELKGGPLSLVTGAEARKEQLSVNPDMRVVNGDIVALGSTQAQGNRRIGSVFAELSAPFAKRVETQLALRYDRYSDFGNSITPHLGVKWKPSNSLALRAAYAEGFLAPSLSTIGSSNVQLFASNLRDPLRCNLTGTTEDCAFPRSTLLRANPDLQPERSNNQTLGLVFEPNTNIALTIDFYRISRTDEITSSRLSDILNNEEQFPGAVIRNPNPATWIPGIPNSGPIQAIILEFVNRGRTVTRGVDVEAMFRNSLGEWGKFTTQFNGTYLIEYKRKPQDDAPYVEYAGGVDSPRFKGSLSAIWVYRNYEVTGRVNHVSGWRYGDSATSCYLVPEEYMKRYNCRIKPWTTLDLSIRYTGMKNLELGFVIRNLQNKPAPLDPDNIELGYNPTFHNPYGRYFNVWMNYTFQ